MDNNLLKSNFIGRDGFRWWIGQVAPEEAQGDQLNQIGSTWGCRLKVRIMGYHPQNTVELEDDDLPWAQVLLSSQCGSGKANRARSIRVAPGDTVLGFFLDGDDAQLPVILGIFGNTNYSPSDEYAGPFKPFTGYTSKIKPNNDFIAKNEGGDDSSSSQKSPRFLTKEIVEDLNKATEEGKVQLDQIINSQELQNATSEVSSELEGFISGAASQTGIKGATANSRELVESLKKKYAYPDTQSFKGIGQEIILGSGVQAAANNTKSTSKVKNVLKNKLSTIKNGIPQDKFKGLAEGASEIVSASKPMIKDMVNTTFDELAPQLNGGLNKLYKDKFGEIMGKTGNLALAKKAAQAAQVAMVGPVMSLQNAMPCAVKNITDKLTGDVLNLLTEFTNNVDNFTDCIGDQFIGALFNDIIKGINTELADVIGGVANIFPSGDIEGLLRSKAEGLLGIASIFDDCDIPTADLGAKTNKWILGVGPGNLNLENIAGKVLAIANAAQSLREAAASPGGIIGNLGLFDFMRPDVSTPGFSSALSDCYTGPPLNCSGIKINLFGGGGQGAQVNPILGAIVNDTFAVQTASLIGMKVINAGAGYKSPPFVEIEDTCRKGYGAVARAVIDYDPSSPTYQQLTDVYVVSSGENYPVIEPEEGDDGVYTVDHVVVVKPGQNYKQEDTVIDDKGNVYEKLLDEQGRILNVIPPDPSMNNVEPFNTLPELEVISSTGIGALLKAQLLPRPSYQGEVRQVIDCISPRNTNIVGFINGEPYYGPFHVHPTTGAKMVGVAHTTSPHAIIYDTPQESRTSRSSVVTSTSYTTVSSSVQTNVSNTTTTSQSDTSSIPQTDPVDTSSQQTSGQSYTPPPSSPPSGGGSSGSGGSGSSGGGGYGGGY